MQVVVGQEVVLGGGEMWLGAGGCGEGGSGTAGGMMVGLGLKGRDPSTKEEPLPLDSSSPPYLW